MRKTTADQAGTLRRSPPESVLFLVPPGLYVVGMGMAQGFGAPYMLQQFLGPGHNHSVIGLTLIFGSLFLSPLLAIVAGVRLLKSGRRLVAVVLALAALSLSLAGAFVRQPYSQVHPSRAVHEPAEPG